MKESDVSDNHHNDCQKAVIAFANFLGANTTFYDIRSKERITAFLDTKIKSREEDPDRKCITTWNHYLDRVKSSIEWSCYST
jgi:hypothetical protein